MEGYIKLHRQIMSWEWYDDSNTFRLFLHLLIKANHADAEWRGQTIKRGQLFTSIDHLAKELKLSYKAIRIAMDKLLKTKEVAIKGANNGTMITICKYDTYQSNEETKGRTKGQPKGERGATNNNDNNENNNLLVQTRISNFKTSLFPFCKPKGIYSSETVKDFFDYWSELNKSETKMKWELQSTFEISKRLAKWDKNESKFSSYGKQETKTDHIY